MESARARLEGNMKGYMRDGTEKSVECCSVALDGKPREVAILSTDNLARPAEFLLGPRVCLAIRSRMVLVKAYMRCIWYHRSECRIWKRGGVEGQVAIQGEVHQ
jgi:hypothetical protein